MFVIDLALRSAVRMSALGQKRTCAAQEGMSALPPKATAKADSRKRRASNGPRFQFGLQARTYLLKQRCCGEARGLSDKINFRNGMTAAIPEAGRTDGHVEFLKLLWKDVL